MYNFFDKEKYVPQLYSRLGLKLKKIHDVLEFSQSQWLKPCVEFNTQKRIEADKMEIKMEKRCKN